jgi:hypothetical protein
MKFICPICKKNFSSYNKKRKTCSRKCTGIYQTKSILKKCDFCKKNIFRSAGNFRHTNVFCDANCQHNWEKRKKVKYPNLRNKKWCIRQYKKKSLKKIAMSIGCGETVVYKFFKIHDIKLDRKQWLRGERSLWWKGGITTLCRAIRTSYDYTKWKKEVWNNSPKKCKICGRTENLEIDHIKKFKFILIDNNIKNLDDARKCEELWNVNNGRILCRSCNKIDCNLNRKSYPVP